jgi:hypothetical protein
MLGIETGLGLLRTMHTNRVRVRVRVRGLVRVRVRVRVREP